MKLKIFLESSNNEYQWRRGGKCGTLVQWLSLLHNFIQQSLNSGSAQVQILLPACWRYAIVSLTGCVFYRNLRLNMISNKFLKLYLDLSVIEHYMWLGMENLCIGLLLISVFRKTPFLVTRFSFNTATIIQMVLFLEML